MSWLKDAFNQVKGAGLEVLEGVGETALAGVVGGIQSANPTTQKNNAPEIGEDGRGNTVTQAPVGNLVPARSPVADFVANMPVWALALGGVSTVVLVGSVVYLVVRK